MSERDPLVHSDSGARPANRSITRSLSQSLGVAAVGPEGDVVAQNMVASLMLSFWFCFLLWTLLIIGMSVAYLVFWIKALVAFSQHGDEPCDVPLKGWMWGVIAAFIYSSVLKSLVERKLLGLRADEPTPRSVRVHNGFVAVLNYVWFGMGLYWVYTSDDCSATNPSLYSAVKSLSLCGVILNTMIFLLAALPAILLLWLVRRGLLSSSAQHAAPSDTADRCKRVDAEAVSPGESCPVCLCALTDGNDRIVQTPCAHMYHRQCLANWLKVARTCPMCRANVAEGVSSGGSTQ